MVRGIHTQKTYQNQTLQTEARWLSVVKDHTWCHHEVETSALPVSAFSGSEVSLWVPQAYRRRCAVGVEERPNSGGVETQRL